MLKPQQKSQTKTVNMILVHKYHHCKIGKATIYFLKKTERPWEKSV